MVAAALCEAIERISGNRDDVAAKFDQNFVNSSETSEFVDAGDSPESAKEDKERRAALRQFGTGDNATVVGRERHSRKHLAGLRAPARTRNAQREKINGDKEERHCEGNDVEKCEARFIRSARGDSSGNENQREPNKRNRRPHGLPQARRFRYRQVAGPSQKRKAERDDAENIHVVPRLRISNTIRQISDSTREDSTQENSTRETDAAREIQRETTHRLPIRCKKDAVENAKRER